MAMGTKANIIVLLLMAAATMTMPVLANDGGGGGGGGSECGSSVDVTFSMLGLQADLQMLALQTRGTIEVISACAFRVRHFEVLASGPLIWRASESPVLSEAIDVDTAKEDVTVQIKARDYPLTGSQSPQFSLLQTAAWDRIGTLLLWDVDKARAVASVVLQKLRPGAAQVAMPQPTVLDNCAQLGPDLRLRWTLDTRAESVDFALDGVLPYGGYASFGPSPSQVNVVNRPMVGSDVTFVGRDTPGGGRNLGPFYAIDSFITSVSECNYGATGPGGAPASGVCDDRVLGGGNASRLNSVLVAGHEADDVTFVRWRRAFNTGDALFDLSLKPNTSQVFVWAMGSVSSSASSSSDLPSSKCIHVGPRFRSHSQIQGETFGWVRLTLSEPTWTCGRLKSVGQELASVAELDDSPQLNGKKATSVILDDRIRLSWTYNPQTSTARFRASTLRNVGWLSVGFGHQMAGARAVVGHVYMLYLNACSEYHMEGVSASSIKLVGDPEVLVTAPLVTDIRFVISNCAFTSTIIDGTPNVFIEFDVDMLTLTRDLDLDMHALPIIWATGERWMRLPVTAAMQHTARSPSPTIINVAAGTIAGAAGLDPSFTAHAILMWTTWLVLVPMGAGAALIRALVLPCVGLAWFRAHTRLAWLATAVAIIGFALGVAGVAARSGAHFADSPHAALGLTSTILLLLQLVNGMRRPDKDDARRSKWLNLHRFLAFANTVLALAATFTGFDRATQLGAGDTTPFTVVTAIWLVAVVASCMILMRWAQKWRTTTTTTTTKGNAAGSAPVAAAASPPTVTYYVNDGAVEAEEGSAATEDAGYLVVSGAVATGDTRGMDCVSTNADLKYLAAADESRGTIVDDVACTADTSSSRDCADTAVVASSASAADFESEIEADDNHALIPSTSTIGIEDDQPELGATAGGSTAATIAGDQTPII
eukprot:UC1_evm2s1453